MTLCYCFSQSSLLKWFEGIDTRLLFLIILAGLKIPQSIISTIYFVSNISEQKITLISYI